MTSISFSALFELLGCPMTNHRWSWSGYSPTHQRALFTLWEDKIINGRDYCLWSPANRGNERTGAKELKRHCDAVLAGSDVTAYGILQRALGVNQSPRVRAWFDRGYVRVLQLREQNGEIFARVGVEIPTLSLVKERVRRVRNVVDDLDSTPQGTKNPDRALRLVSHFMRDEKVREHVISHANGQCEHCGKLGFEMGDGRRYLEAHHIIALAEQGPDTIENVIALCPQHHREAHYGLNADALEAEFKKRIKQRNRA